MSSGFATHSGIPLAAERIFGASTVLETFVSCFCEKKRFAKKGRFEYSVMEHDLVSSKAFSADLAITKQLPCIVLNVANMARSFPAFSIALGFGGRVLSTAFLYFDTLS